MAHGPYLRGQGGGAAFVTVESFRFVFGEATVKDDDWAFAFGPSACAGYAIWYLAGDAGYQHLWMGGSSAGCYRFRLGVRFYDGRDGDAGRTGQAGELHSARGRKSAPGSRS